LIGTASSMTSSAPSIRRSHRKRRN
jgi:hypothetical protein